MARGGVESIVVGADIRSTAPTGAGRNRLQIARRKAGWIVAAFVALWMISRAIPAPELIATHSWSHAVYDRNGKILRLSLAPDEQYRLWTPLRDISPAVIEATLLEEDSHFFAHPGVNPLAIARAAVTTYLTRSRRMGGSTITMQLARRRFGIRSRGIGSKIQQIARALQIEHSYSKSKILEAYLNLAPYGGNIEGVGAASLIYFHKPAKELTLPEALTLAVIPQNPLARSPASVANEEREAITPPSKVAPTAALRMARERLLSRWLERHPEDQPLRDTLEKPFLSSKSSELPFTAPHFVNRILKRSPAESGITTTLDTGAQKIIEHQVQSYVARHSMVGVTNASALLVDYRSMEVRALVGSANFFDTKILGQVDGTSAKRSPGSALKPFIYGLAIDQGIIRPKSILKDTPRSYAAYNPENFDREFVGPIPAGEALVRSRNLPAIELTNSLKAPGFYGFLQHAGIRQLREEKFYGLALALGGIETTMEELVSLYSMLGNGGILRPLSFTASEVRDRQAAPPLRLLSPEAAYLTLEMLRENPRPIQEGSERWLRNLPTVAWKTGTSFGFRDAWSVGVFGPYVVAVWLGNFDGTPNPAFVGRELAGPLLFQIIDALNAAGYLRDSTLASLPSKGLNIKKVQVCAVSGQLPGPHCRHITEDWFIPGVSPIGRCTVHREVLVNPVNGLRSCHPNYPGLKPEIFEFWSSDLLHLFGAAGLSRRRAPPFEPGCVGGDLLGQPPEITSPDRAVSYTIRVSGPEVQPIPLTAIGDGSSRTIYWFDRDSLLGKSPPGQPLLWTPTAGHHVIRAVDEFGRTDRRELEIIPLQ